MTEEQKRVSGRIIKVSQQGWGFISSRDIEFTRIFFHWTSLRQDTLNWKELKSGMNVEFLPVQILGKGWRAIHVKVIERVHQPEVATEVEVVDADVPALPQ